jgi:putative MATE family efflux protein
LNGAAYAAVISSLLTFVLLLGYLQRKQHVLKLDTTILKNFKWNGSVLKNLLRLAIPTSVSMIAISLSEVAVISFVNEYGSNATAAYGVVNQIASYVQIPAISISIAVSVFVAQFIGSGKTSNIKQVTKTGVILNYLLGGVLILLLYLFSTPILNVFLDNTETIEIAQGLILISFWSYVIIGNTQVLSATMRATGSVLWPTLFTISSIILVQVPVAYILSHFTDMGIKGIWLAYPIAFIANLIAQYLYYRFNWKSKSLKALLE